MKRIWWFKRLKDSYYFPIDDETAASNTLRRKDFERKFEYIGWSDGKLLAPYIASPTQTPDALQEQLRPGMYDKRRQLMREVYTKEVQKAMQNPDKSKPQFHDVVDLNGKKSDNNLLIQSVRRIR